MLWNVGKASCTIGSFVITERYRVSKRSGQSMVLHKCRVLRERPPTLPRH